MRSAQVLHMNFDILRANRILSLDKLRTQITVVTMLNHFLAKTWRHDKLLGLHFSTQNTMFTRTLCIVVIRCTLATRGYETLQAPFTQCDWCGLRHNKWSVLSIWHSIGGTNKVKSIKWHKVIIPPIYVICIDVQAHTMQAWNSMCIHFDRGEKQMANNLYAWRHDDDGRDKTNTINDKLLNNNINWHRNDYPSRYK